MWLFNFVAVKMVYRIVLESTSIFQCVPDIISHWYLYIYIYSIITRIHL